MAERSTYTLSLTEAEAEELRGLVPGRTLRRRVRIVRENADYAGTVVRMVRALGKRAGGDVELLPQLASMAELIGELMAAAVAQCRAEGYSWGEIAQRVGTTRQAAQQRYGATNADRSIERQDRVDAHSPVAVT